MSSNKLGDVGYTENSKAKKNRIKLLAEDVFSGLFRFATIWLVLGWLDIKQRYRRSVLGPFWLTISTSIMVAALGLVYSGLFKQALESYLPYLAVGLIVWTLLSSLLNESCAVFTAAESMIKQVRLPLTVHVMRMVWRNLIIFFHNAVVLIVVVMFFSKGLSLSLLSIPFALLIIAINGLWIGLILGTFCSRFRDISPIVMNFTQLLFFITPIFWHREALVEREWLVQFNPIHHFIEIVRTPILNSTLAVESWSIVGLITIFLGFSAFVVLNKYRHRVAYWV